MSDAWQDISTAPKDGTEILAWHLSGNIHNVAWDVDQTGPCWLQCVGMSEHRWEDGAFTFWQPIVPPLTSQSSVPSPDRE